MLENNKPYPVLENELERLKKLYYYDILGIKPEPQFDDLTGLAAQILNLPICQITLMDADWQDFISNHGVDMDGNHREMSFCQYTVVQNEVLEIEDTTVDEKFKDHPLVTGEPYLKYYVGAPLIDDEGFVLGTLCGYGMESMRLSVEQKNMLVSLAKTVIRLIKYRKINKDQEKFVNIFSLNQDLLCVMSKEGYFKLVNPAFKHLLGWSEDELLAYPILKFVHREDRVKVHDELKELQLEKEKYGFSCRLMTKTGHPIWFSWSYFSDSDSNVIVASGHDMTALLETQKSLEITINDLNKASSVKDEFLSNMSHEIRTPLASIKGFTELLDGTNLNEDQRQHVESIKVASSHLMNIVNDVLDIYKLEDGKLELEHQSLSLKELFIKIERLLKQSALVKGIEFKVEYDEHLPQRVLADETRLIQVFSNLLGNAIKFTDSGQVCLKASLMTRDNSNAVVEFEVTDTGIGMNEDALNTVFERFSQAEVSTTRKYGGTGLGLSISKHVVDLFNSEIKVESELGRGTRFWFEIDFEILEEGSQMKNTDKDFSDFNILLAEDNEQLQLLCKIHIENYNGTIDTVNNGKEAIEALKSNRYDVVLMDIQMPVMNGIEATHYLRNELKLTIPIIGFSANANIDESNLCIEAGMNDFISKPFSITDLLGKIHNQISNREFNNEIDKAMNKLLKEEGPDLVEQFLHIFIRRTPKDIDDLKAFHKSKNYPELSKKAHFLASTFRSMNLIKGEKLAFKIQESADLNETHQVLELSKKLIDFLEKALSQISQNQ